MTVPADNTAAWRLFRRVFLWTLAAFALAWSIRTDAADEPALPLPPAAPATPDAALPPMPMPSPMESVAAPIADGEADATCDIPGASVTHFPQDDWTVTIRPNPITPADQLRRRYEEVYASIPYRKQEYLANPGYRHESTLELMFGQLRPKTVVSQYQPRTIPAPFFTNYKPYMDSRNDLYTRWYPSNAPFGFGLPLTPYYPAYPRYPVHY